MHDLPVTDRGAWLAGAVRAALWAAAAVVCGLWLELPVMAIVLWAGAGGVLSGALAVRERRPERTSPWLVGLVDALLWGGSVAVVAFSEGYPGGVVVLTAVAVAVGFGGFAGWRHHRDDPPPPPRAEPFPPAPWTAGRAGRSSGPGVAGATGDH